MYSDQDRNADFDFFVQHYNDLFNQYGHCYLAIKNKQVLGSYASVSDAIDDLSSEYEMGTYIIQECSGSHDAYIVRIMRFLICLGDFAISNLNKETSFSFRIPSVERIGFVKDYNDSHGIPSEGA